MEDGREHPGQAGNGSYKLTLEGTFQRQVRQYTLRGNLGPTPGTARTAASMATRGAARTQPDPPASTADNAT